MKKLFYFLISLFILNSCSKYQKILKSTDQEYKFEMAKTYYEQEDYFRALPIFDELKLYFSGSEKSEEVSYYLAYTHYALSEYLVASYHFRNFVSTFPNSEKSEEMSYMNAYCHYLKSPTYSLDAFYTSKAIDEFQYFVNRYPVSSRLDTCNQLIDKLREKLEKKSFHIAKQYYDTKNYKSAIIALNNVMIDFPDTDYAEEIQFLILDSSYLLASNSVSAKQQQRWKNTLGEYHKFIDRFENSEKLKEAENIYNKTNKQLDKIQ